MSKILVTPVKTSGIAPYEVSGDLIIKTFDGEKIYYIGGRSFPESIVTVLNDAAGAKIKRKGRVRQWLKRRKSGAN